jgi:hypothetical protein
MSNALLVQLLPAYRRSRPRCYPPVSELAVVRHGSCVRTYHPRLSRVDAATFKESIQNVPAVV